MQPLGRQGLSYGIMNDDKDKVYQILQGDRKAFTCLIKEHERLVKHMVCRVINNPEDVEEVCQDVFMKVYDQLEKFNFQSKLSTWIATIAYRMSINYVKKKKIPLENPEQAEKQFLKFSVFSESVEKEISEKDLSRYIHLMIEKLPLHYRTVLSLYHLEEMSIPEIEEVTGMPEGTVKNYLFRARKLMKDKLEKFLKKEELI